MIPQTISDIRRINRDILHDCDEIICHALGIDRARLLMQGDTLLEGMALEEILKRLTRLRDGEPLQYILNRCDFYGREFFVDNRVLIPRFDTEILVENALLQQGVSRVADICCGSGCIGLSLLCERQNVHATLLDISCGALDVCRINAERLGVLDRCDIHYFDVMSDECWGALGVFDLIVSNPPYIPTEDIKSLSVQVKKEPYIALDGGIDGMDFYKKIIESSKGHFTNGVNIIFEIGYDEGAKMKALASSCGLNCKIKRDLNGCDRVALLNEGERSE